MKKTLQVVAELITIAIGAYICALGVNGFLIPSELMAGGITGICMILYHLFGWSTGTLYFIANAPLLIMGYLTVGRKFILYTIAGSGLVSIFLNIIPVQLIGSDDKLLSCIFGGVISSIGAGMVLRMGGSTGGLDLLGRIIVKYKDISLGRFTLAINILIILVSAYYFTLEAAMYTLVSLFVGAKTYEVILNHVDRITVLIISDKGDDVSEAIIKSMVRGVTKWGANGCYAKTDKKILLSVIVNNQFEEMKRIVMQEDPNAFIAVLPTTNVVGNFTKAW